MATHEPLRGEVWDVRFPAFGEHPAVVLSINRPNGRLAHVTLIPITSVPGPESTHVMLNGDVDVTGHDQSYADVTGLQPTELGRFRRRRGLLAAGDLARVEARLRVYLGL